MVWGKAAAPAPGWSSGPRAGGGVSGPGGGTWGTLASPGTPHPAGMLRSASPPSRATPRILPMDNPRPTTVGALKASGYQSRPVKDELRANLIRKLRSGETLFPGIQGYEDTVVPQLVNAVLARHDFILLGLAGQAKTGSSGAGGAPAEEIPCWRGRDQPRYWRPVSKYGGKLVVGEWGTIGRALGPPGERRYGEAGHPDVTIRRHDRRMWNPPKFPKKRPGRGDILGDELTTTTPAPPGDTRGIFAINEIPEWRVKI